VLLTKVGKSIFDGVKTKKCNCRLVYAAQSDILVRNSALDEHTLFKNEGGVLHLIDSLLVLDNTNISNTKGSKLGGAIYVETTTLAASERQPAAFLVDFKNVGENRFVDNSAETAGGVGYFKGEVVN
jgi:hypothetical protein